jgi:hypothetical protein
MVRWPIAACVLLASTTALAQQQPKSDPRPAEVDIPLPITSPRYVRPGIVEPLSPEEKITRVLKNTFYPRAIANRALIAGFDQLRDSPEEWGGDIEGYGQRFGTRMGRLAVRNAVQLSTDLAFGLEPRYDRCACSGFWDRTRHAWKRVVVARRDNGGETFAVSTFAGAYVPPFVTDPWLPDRYHTLRNKFESGTQFLLTRGATNMLREFWPDIARKLKLGRFKPD